MTYKKSFEDLFKQFEEISEAVVRSADISTKTLIELFNGNANISCDELVRKLIAISVDNTNADYNSIIWVLSRPHIGLGNPNSKVLIIGKELGFEETKKFPVHALKHWTCPNPPDDYYKRLFVNEVLLNYYLWAVKVQGHNIPPSKLCCFQDPEFPASFCHLYNLEKRGLHTWKLINKVFEIKHNQQFPFTTNTLGQSFFQHCFLTELNLVPSSKSIFVDGLTRGRISKSDIDNRFELLTNSLFYNEFETIVFGCHSYLNKYVENYSHKIEVAYNVRKTNFSKTRNILELYTGHNKNVIITHQLSGSRTWSNDELNQLASMF